MAASDKPPEAPVKKCHYCLKPLGPEEKDVYCCMYHRRLDRKMG